VRIKPLGLDSQTWDELKASVDKIKESGIGVDDFENTIPVPKYAEDIATMRDNGVDWPENLAHRGSHPPEYYEKLNDILKTLPDNPSREQVVDVMNSIFDDISEGRLPLRKDQVEADAG